jgi:hypothetical protein
VGSPSHDTWTVCVRPAPVNVTVPEPDVRGVPAYRVIVTVSDSPGSRWPPAELRLSEVEPLPVQSNAAPDPVSVTVQVVSVVPRSQLGGCTDSDGCTGGRGWEEADDEDDEYVAGLGGTTWARVVLVVVTVAVGVDGGDEPCP